MKRGLGLTALCLSLVLSCPLGRAAAATWNAATGTLIFGSSETTFTAGTDAVDGFVYASVQGINLSGPALETLDLSACSSLIQLIGQSACPRLKNLTLPSSTGNFTTLNVDGTAIEELDLSPYTGLSHLQAQNCASLRTLDISNTSLTTNLFLAGSSNLRTLKASGSKLTKLGLEDFGSLKTLDVSGCSDLDELSLEGTTKSSLATLNASGTAIKELALSKYDSGGAVLIRGGVTDLDLSGCASLVSLDCDDASGLSTLKVGNCASLRYLSAGGNSFSALDVSTCPSLRQLYCNNNKSLAALTLGSLPNLTVLYCNGTSVTGLNLGGLPRLTTLNCRDSRLAALNVSGNPLLAALDVSGTDLTSLDVSALDGLKTLTCSNKAVPAFKVTAVEGGFQVDFNGYVSDVSSVSGVQGVGASGAVETAEYSGGVARFTVLPVRVNYRINATAVTITDVIALASNSGSGDSGSGADGDGTGTKSEGERALEELSRDATEEVRTAIDLIWRSGVNVGNMTTEEVQRLVALLADIALEVRTDAASEAGGAVTKTTVPAARELPMNSEALEELNDLSAQPKVVTPEAVTGTDFTALQQKLAQTAGSGGTEPTVPQNFSSALLRALNASEIAQAPSGLRQQAQVVEGLVDKLGGGLSRLRTQEAANGVVIATVLSKLTPASSGFFPMKLNLRQLVPGRRLRFWHSAEAFQSAASAAALAADSRQETAFFLDENGNPTKTVAGDPRSVTVVPYLTAGMTYDTAFVTVDATEADAQELRTIVYKRQVELGIVDAGKKSSGGGCSLGLNGLAALLILPPLLRRRRG